MVCPLAYQGGGGPRAAIERPQNRMDATRGFRGALPPPLPKARPFSAVSPNTYRLNLTYRLNNRRVSINLVELWMRRNAGVARNVIGVCAMRRLPGKRLSLRRRLLTIRLPLERLKVRLWVNQQRVETRSPGRYGF